MKDISVTKLDIEGSDNTLAAYSLQPDGLQLNDAVDVEIKVANKGNTIPEIFHISGGDDEAPVIERLENVEVFLYSHTNEAIITGALRHFSRVNLVGSNAYELIIDDLKDQYIGEPFNIVAQTVIDMRTHDYTYYDRSGTEKYGGTFSLISEPKSVTIHGNFFGWNYFVEKEFGSYKSLLNPTKVLDRPLPDIKITENQSYESSATFTCVRPGLASISFKVRVTSEGKQQTWYASRPLPDKNLERERWWNDGVIITNFRCLEREKSDEAVIGEEPDDAVQPAPEPHTPAPQDADTGGDIEAEVIFLNGRPYYSAHFYSLEPEGSCPVTAWYTANFDSVWGWESPTSPKLVSTYYADEENIGCGFGSVAEHPAQIIKITKEMAEAMGRAHGKGFIDGCHHTCR